LPSQTASQFLPTFTFMFYIKIFLVLKWNLDDYKTDDEKWLSVSEIQFMRRLHASNQKQNDFRRIKISIIKFVHCEINWKLYTRGMENNRM
jgi:hypothetical protein